ncbi:MAG TPA: lipid droplet-associated protein [Mycobacterium sp.]|nr:lipid droplet-associated protein [Mycobacterium sp.]
MATAPYGVRLLVGAATIAVEETRKLPQTILTYPMTLVSQAAHFVMRWQQGLAELAIKGDSTLETLFPPKDEQPEWAQFDEDFEEPDGVNDTVELSTDFGDAATDRGRRPEGRFALYSSGSSDTVASRPGAGSANTTAAIPAPEVAAELDYPTLTLAQLRARLRTLSVDDLQDLLSYEEATKARAPFQTLLANGITRATAK